MPDDYINFINENIGQVINTHQGIFLSEPEMVKFLKHIITNNNIALDQEYLIGDICCGLGHISYHLKNVFPNSNFLGIDISKEQIKVAKQIFSDFNLINRYSFETGDIYNLKKYEFDIAVNWMTLSWLEDYKEPIKNIIFATKDRGHIFISSLFNDHDVDIYNKVFDYTRPSGKAGISAHYNAYCIRKFKEYVLSLGVSKVEVHDFEISLDLPKTTDGLGTYTLKLENGKRIQVSGGILMNWKIIHIIK